MTSWYTHLNRDQAYLRSYRTHNLWLDQYHKKIRTSRITPFHIGVLKRLGKTYSGVSAVTELTFAATCDWLRLGTYPHVRIHGSYQIRVQKGRRR